MDSDHDTLTVGSAVRVPAGEGHIWRFGWITRIDGETIVVDLGRDGRVTTSQDQVRKL